MSTCDARDEIFLSYSTNVRALHIPWTQLQKGCYNQCDDTWLLGAEMISKKYSPLSFLCDLCHNIYDMVVFRPNIFCSDYMWKSKFKIWVWARLVIRADLSVSTPQWSSHMSQCLRNNWVNRGRNILVHFTAQVPLRMHKTPPDVTLTGACSNLKPHSRRLLSLDWTLLIYHDRAPSLRLWQIWGS